jgi:hypothetical protein
VVTPPPSLNGPTASPARGAAALPCPPVLPAEKLETHCPARLLTPPQLLAVFST